MSLAALEAVRVERHGDDDYIYYETASRGGPTFVDPKAATYRRGAGVVARRGGAERVELGPSLLAEAREDGVGAREEGVLHVLIERE